MSNLWRGLRSFTAVLVLLMIVPASADAGIVYVKWDSPGPTFDGTSWDTAFHKVQEGLNAAASGDEVWVAAGTYVENITLKDGVGLYGGFAGTETALEQRDWTTNVTILDGNRAGSVVIAPSGTTASTRIDGLTIQNGSAAYGGGIYCYNASPTIANNTVTGNTASGRGGGIALAASFGLLSNNTVSGNTAATDGGGIFIQSGTPVISGNTITSNGAATYGGGIYCRYSYAEITGNTVSTNTLSAAEACGVGIAVAGGAPTIRVNTISEHDSPYVGGGVYLDNCSGTIEENMVTGNTAASRGGASTRT